VICFDNISITFDKTVVKNFRLEIPPGGHIAFMGPSGCGKTSLLRAAAGLLKPAKGFVRRDSDRISYVFQEPRLLPWLTALENVNLVLGGRPETLPVSRKCLEAVGLSEAADQYPAELSGGMRRRVSLARAIAFDGDILLLDEPTAGLDDAQTKDILALICDFSAGKTLLVATHSREEAKILADRIFLCRDGAFQEE